MAEFLLDEDVSEQAAPRLNGAGHRAVTVRELSLKGAKDYVVLLRGAETDCIVVTHNGDDFFLHHGAWLLWNRAWGVAPRHAGILVVPQMAKLRPIALVQELDAFAAAGLLTENVLYLWRAQGGWVRREPV